MSKGQNSRNNSKKKPLKTMKEKKAAKREKKSGHLNPDLFDKTKAPA